MALKPTRSPQPSERFVALHSAKISNHRDAHEILYALDTSGLVWEYRYSHGRGTIADPKQWAWFPLTNERSNA